MKIAGYTSWASHVNKVILDSSTIDVGEDNKKNSQTEGGGTRSFTSGFFVPDRYSVTMEFSWLDDDQTPIDGENEYTRFLTWYKYIHKYGRVPFEFPQILYSPEDGVDAYDSEADKNYKTEYYKITNITPGKKVGDMMSFTMTWETVFTGIIDLDKDNLKETISGSSIEAHNGYIDVGFPTTARTEPASSNFKLYITPSGEREQPTDVVGFRYDNNVARVYFAKQPKNGAITFSYNSDTLSVAKDTYRLDYKA